MLQSVVKADDEGYYKCNITNSAGELEFVCIFDNVSGYSVTSEAAVHIWVSPSITLHPSNVIEDAHLSRTVTFSCSATGDTPSSVPMTYQVCARLCRCVILVVVQRWR